MFVKINKIWSLGSETEFGVNAEDFSIGNIRSLAMSSKGNIVVTRWGVTWNVPGDIELVAGSVVMDSSDVFIIEGSSVPVNMDVEVINFHELRDDSSEHEFDILSLNNWVW